MTTAENPLDVITAILASPKHARGTDVREWPADEAEAHRNFEGDFTERNTAVKKLRDAKIAAGILEAVSPLIRAGAWTDAAVWIESTVTTKSPSARLEMYADNELRASALRQLPDTNQIHAEIRNKMSRRLLAGEESVVHELRLSEGAPKNILELAHQLFEAQKDRMTPETRANIQKTLDEVVPARD